MTDAPLVSLKQELKNRGFEQKAIVSDEEMARARRIVDSLDGIVDTPVEELRYIEGLLKLPFGYIDLFRILPKGQRTCACGRTPTALDLVSTSLRKQIHNEEIVRDTLIGFSNLIELSEAGRTAECISCGRSFSSKVYWTRRYMYA
jgi:hypothetical protein